MTNDVLDADDDDDDRWLTRREVADRWRIDVETVARRVRQGLLPEYVDGRIHRISMRDVREWERRHHVDGGFEI